MKGVHHGPAFCPDCEREWPESKWTLSGEVILYWCPVCCGELELLDGGRVDPGTRGRETEEYDDFIQEGELLY